MKNCRICMTDKELSFFQCFISKGKYISYRTECNECRNAVRRTGNKAGRTLGSIPWNKGEGITKNVWRAKEWVSLVKERDKYICQHCGCKDKKKMQAHHIVPWKDSVELRFELSNGMTLCRSCHTKEDRRIHPEIDALRGHVVTEKTREKIRNRLKGRSPSNKGKKGQVAWNKGIPQTDEVKKKLSESLLRYNRDTGKRVCFNK